MKNIVDFKLLWVEFSIDILGFLIGDLWFEDRDESRSLIGIYFYRPKEHRSLEVKLLFRNWTFYI